MNEAVRQFIESRRVAHLATVGRDGMPHVVPVCFGLVNEMVFTPIDAKPKSTLKLRRRRNIEATGRASLVFDRYSEDWQRLGWVMVQGRAMVLDRGDERSDALARLRGRYEPYRSMPLESLPLIAVSAENTVSWGNLSPDAT